MGAPTQLTRVVVICCLGMCAPNRTRLAGCCRRLQGVSLAARRDEAVPGRVYRMPQNHRLIDSPLLARRRAWAALLRPTVDRQRSCAAHYAASTAIRRGWSAGAQRQASRAASCGGDITELNHEARIKASLPRPWPRPWQGACTSPAHLGKLPPTKAKPLSRRSSSAKVASSSYPHRRAMGLRL